MNLADLPELAHPKMIGLMGALGDPAQVVVSLGTTAWVHRDPVRLQPARCSCDLAAGVLLAPGFDNAALTLVFDGFADPGYAFKFARDLEPFSSSRRAFDLDERYDSGCEVPGAAA